jgi:hypothetical protein
MAWNRNRDSYVLGGRVLARRLDSMGLEGALDQGEQPPPLTQCNRQVSDEGKDRQGGRELGKVTSRRARC